MRGHRHRPGSGPPCGGSRRGRAPSRIPPRIPQRRFVSSLLSLPLLLPLCTSSLILALRPHCIARYRDRPLLSPCCVHKLLSFLWCLRVVDIIVPLPSRLRSPTILSTGSASLTISVVLLSSGLLAMYYIPVAQSVSFLSAQVFRIYGSRYIHISHVLMLTVVHTVLQHKGFICGMSILRSMAAWPLVWINNFTRSIPQR